jgi:hypothetical protein
MNFPVPVLMVSFPHEQSLLFQYLSGRTRVADVRLMLRGSLVHSLRLPRTRGNKLSLENGLCSHLLVFAGPVAYLVEIHPLDMRKKVVETWAWLHNSSGYVYHGCTQEFFFFVVSFMPSPVT